MRDTSEFLHIKDKGGGDIQWDAVSFCPRSILSR